MRLISFGGYATRKLQALTFVSFCNFVCMWFWKLHCNNRFGFHKRHFKGLRFKLGPFLPAQEAISLIFPAMFCLNVSSEILPRAGWEVRQWTHVNTNFVMDCPDMIPEITRWACHEFTLAAKVISDFVVYCFLVLGKNAFMSCLVATLATLLYNVCMGCRNKCYKKVE